MLCKLRSLNISRNSLVGTSEFKCLQKLTGLCVLNVGQMEDMMGDAVLFFLAGEDTMHMHICKCIYVNDAFCTQLGQYSI